MTEASEKAKPGPKPKAKVPDFHVALHNINGVIAPGTPLVVTDKAVLKELLDLEAVREASDAEAALFEKSADSVLRLGDADPADALD